MSSDKKERKKVTRKEFVKGTAVGAAGVAAAGVLAGCAPAATPTPQVIKETVEVPVEVTREVIKEVEVTREVVKEAQPWLPEKWDKEADVVVVGYGLAGASAAIHAHDAGAKVLILEKMPKGREGGNSKVSGNLVFIPGNVEDGKTYFKAMAEGHLNDMPEELVQAWAEEMVANREWLESIGIDPLPMPPALGMSPELPHLPGSETMVIYSMGGKLGNAALWDPVVEEVTSRGIEILYETPGKKLVATCEGEVVGIIAESGGSEIAIKAKNAVILTCGGMEFDETMKANYLAAPCYSVGTPGNTGDGIRMAQAVGADLWHMNNFMGPISTGFFLEGLDPEIANIPVWGSMPGQSYIYVDKYGKRFMNETRPSDHGHGWHEINYYDGNKAEYPRIPWWAVFDEAVRTAGALTFTEFGGAQIKMSWFGWFSDYAWSPDNSAEIEKGWILKGDTIEELADAMGVDSTTLAATVATFNEYAAAGEDAEYGRAAPTLVALEPPFYAIKSWPIMVNTQGGPKRNHKAQVMHINGNPIPRLYSAGECGSVYAWLYQGGGNLGECLAFGRIAGRNAAAETPWG